MASQNLNVGTSANAGDGMSLRQAFVNTRKMFADMYGITYTSDTQDLSGTTFGIDYGQLANRYAASVSVTTLTGTVSFNCANGSVFKLSGDLTGTYTISLTGYKKGQIITIYPLKVNQTLNLAGAGSSTNTFNKIGGVNYNDDGSTSNILQIECVDDSATDPVFFYSLATFASDSSDI